MRARLGCEEAITIQYRTFGKIDFRPSALGFGCMRFPRHEDRSIDQEKVTAMLRYAIDHGVNYFDTAYVYKDSEVAVGKALADGYRDRVKLATKLPVLHLKTLADADRIFAEHLTRLGTDYIDFYLLHALNAKHWAKTKELGLLDWCERKLAEGAVGHLGFSYHGGLDTFREIVDAYPNWEFTQLQYNYIDTDYETGRAGVRYAHENGLGLIVMEPLRGGLLAKVPIPEVRAMFEAAPGGHQRTPVDWALQWLWNQPEVSTLISGMTSLEETVENIASAERSGIGTMAGAEEEFLARVGEAIRAKMGVPCTSCEYCLPCPQGIDIPGCFNTYNMASASLPDQKGLARRLAEIINRWPKERRPDQCTACGVCSERCPQGIVIHEKLARIVAEVDEAAAARA